jgi:hypothetical protein
MDTIAADAGCCPRTVRTALARLAELGLVRWINRLVRVGPRAQQTSNAYTLIVAAVAAFVPRVRRATRCTASGGKSCRETRSDLIQESGGEKKDGAIAALARIRQLWEEQRAARFS